jgi:hypothetical protein
MAQLKVLKVELLVGDVLKVELLVGESFPLIFAWPR